MVHGKDTQRKKEKEAFHRSDIHKKPLEATEWSLFLDSGSHDYPRCE